MSVKPTVPKRGGGQSRRKRQKSPPALKKGRASEEKVLSSSRERAPGGIKRVLREIKTAKGGEETSLERLRPSCCRMKTIERPLH